MDLLKRLVKGGSSPPPSLPEDVQRRLEACLQCPPEAAAPLTLARYVVVAIVSEGDDPAQQTISSIAALGVRQGVFGAADAVLIDSLANIVRLGDFQLQRALLACMEHVGQSSLLTWQARPVEEAINRLCVSHLGHAWSPSWISLAALLPRLFGRRGPAGNAMDDWLAHFGIEIPGRLTALPDAVAMARLLQLALSEAARQGIESSTQLREFERALRWPGK